MAVYKIGDTITIEGVLIREPDLVYTYNGKLLVKARIWNNETNKHMNLVIWEELASKFNDALHKNDKIRVTGKLGSYAPRENNGSLTIVQLTVFSFYKIGNYLEDKDNEKPQPR